MWREADRPPLLGLAGVASGLYFLSQVGLLLPARDKRLIAPLDGFLISTNLATVVLLCLLGHLVGRRLLAARRDGWLGPLRAFLGWLVSLLVLLALVCGAVALTSRLDPLDTTSDEDTTTSILHVLSLTWNQWLADHLLTARSDLTALYLFSVAAQLVAVSTVLVTLLGRRPGAVGVLAVGGALAAAIWRAATYEPDSWVRDSLATVHYADAFFAGLAAAALAPRVRVSSQTASAVCGGLVLALVGAVIATAFWSQEVQAQMLPSAALLTAAFCVCADHLPSTRGLTIEALSATRWQRMAGTWPFVVAWTYAVVVTVGRRSFGENRYLAALVALVLVALLVRLTGVAERRATGLLTRGRGHRVGDRPAPVEVGPPTP